MKYKNNIIIVLAFLLMQNTVWSQGNTPCTATPITAGATCTYTPGTTVGATYQNNGNNGGTPSCASPGAADVWYSFTPTVSGNHTIDLQAGGITDSGMGLYSGGACNSLSEVTCDDDGGTGTMSQITANLTAGTTYYIRVWEYFSGTGTFGICVTSPGGGGGGPANNLCSNATALPCGTVSLAGTTVGTTNPANAAGCSMSDYGVWYSFPGDGLSTTITVSGGTLDAEMAITSGTCAAQTNITCEDGAGTGGTETYTFVTTIGLTYYVYVAHYSTIGTTTGTFNISRSCTAAPVPPANDEPCTATALTVGASCSFGTYTTANATNSSLTVGVTLPTCSSYNGADVWFTVTVPASGHLIFDSNTGVILDSGMEIYRGTCGSLTAVDCDDDGSANGAMSMIDQNTLIPGETIWIRMWEYGGDNNGTFDICVYDGGGGGGGGPCAGGAGGNDCPQQQPICTDNTYCYTAGIGSTASSGNNYGCLATQPNPSWYYFEISTAGNLVFDLSATSDIDFAVWGPFANAAAASAACGSLGAPVDCSYSISPTEQVNLAGVAVGQVYVLVVTNYAAVVQDITLGAAGGNTAATNCAIVNPTPCAADAGNW